MYFVFREVELTVQCVQETTLTCEDIDIQFMHQKVLDVSIKLGEKCVLPCDSSPCQNGASCVDIGRDDYECVCPDNWIGRHCEICKSFLDMSCR